ncbi:MAG: hypothetical protein Kow0022_18720 [Phycisphaerales bacterium]
MKQTMPIPKRRGMALLAVVVMIAIIHLTVLRSVSRGSADADIVSLRVETARAFFAADSGVMIWLREDAAGTPPEPGETLSIGSMQILIVDAPEAGAAGTLTVEGSSSRARRRLSVELE